MSSALNYIMGAVIVGLTLFVLALLADNSGYKSRLSECNSALAEANASAVMSKAVIAQSNTRIREMEIDLRLMQSNGAIARSEAAREISKLEEQIENIYREPKAATCEEVRVKMLKYATKSVKP